MADLVEYTYRGKTFRVGDIVKIKRTTQGWSSEQDLLGKSARISRIDKTDNTLCVSENGHRWWISMDSTFESDQEEEPTDDNPLGMPELKIWMRFLSDITGQWYILLPGEDGKLCGFRKGGFWLSPYENDAGITAIAESPKFNAELLDFSHNPIIIWKRASAEKKKKAAEAQKLKDEIAALQEKLKELE